MEIKGSYAPCRKQILLLEVVHEAKPCRVVLSPDMKFIKYVKMSSFWYFRIFINHSLSFEHKIIHKGESLVN